jgi:hypothetical protein
LVMFSDSAEALKNQYTDKYVKVDAARPELARFRDAVGQVKTVNMNGRALVEFLDYHLNIGWFDIDLSCLTVVDPPPKDVTAKPEPKRAHDKPEGKAAPTSGDKQVADAKATAAAGAKKLSPLDMARMQGAGGKGAAAAPKAEPAKPPLGRELGAERQAASKPSSTADILAAARAKSASPPAAAAPVAPAPKPEPPKAAPPPPAPAPPAPAPTAAAGGIVRVDKSSMTIADMIAYCRARDAK